MNYWLLKSEPSDYSIDDLQRDATEPWDGIRNYQVRNMIRDDIKVGDTCIFYHSNTDVIGCVGTMKIASEAYPDPTQFDSKSAHPDPKSDPENPRWLCMDVAFESKFKRTVTLAEIKSDPTFSDMRLVMKGNRLSVMPISKKHFQKISRLGSS